MPLIGPVSSSATETGSFGRVEAETDILVKDTSIWGDPTAAALTVSGDASSDYDAQSLKFTAAMTPADNKIWRTTGDMELYANVTVDQQNGLARGTTAVYGGFGVDINSTIGAVGTKATETPERPGTDTTSKQGGRIQMLAKGTVTVTSACTISAVGATSGGGGGLVVIIAGKEISGSGNITATGAAGTTGTAKGGGGGYSGYPGGMSGFAGGGGGKGAHHPSWGGGNAGAAGSGIVSAEAGTAQGGEGGYGMEVKYRSEQNIAGYWRSIRELPGTSPSGDPYGGGAGGGDNDATDGAGGGGGGGQGGVGGDGGNGGAGVFIMADTSDGGLRYAGLPGGQGGGGGGGGSKNQAAGGGGGNGGPALTSLFSNTGQGVGGNGEGGGGGGAGGGNPNHGGNGVAGGSGGGGGGAAGLIVLVAPTISWGGTAIGKVIKIAGTDALNFIKGVSA